MATMNASFTPTDKMYGPQLTASLAKGYTNSDQLDIYIYVSPINLTGDNRLQTETDTETMLNAYI